MESLWNIIEPKQISNAMKELYSKGYVVSCYSSKTKDAVELINKEYGRSKPFVAITPHRKHFIDHIHWKGNGIEIVEVFNKYGIKVIWNGQDNYRMDIPLTSFGYRDGLKYAYDIYDSRREAKERTHEFFRFILTEQKEQNQEGTYYDYIMKGGWIHDVKIELQNRLKLNTFTMDYFIKYQGGPDEFIKKLKNYNRILKLERILSNSPQKIICNYGIKYKSRLGI